MVGEGLRRLSAPKTQSLPQKTVRTLHISTPAKGRLTTLVQHQRRSREMGKRRKPDGVLEGTVNHYALLKHDADKLTQMAKAASGSFETTITARSAILLYIVSLEVLINRVIDEFWPSSIPAVFQEDAKMCVSSN